jgi:hypothetical protein
MHRIKRLNNGLDENSDLFRPFKRMLALGMPVPHEHSLQRVCAALRKQEEHAFTSDDLLHSIAIEKGIQHGVLERVGPEPAIMRTKCVHACAAGLLACR